MPFAVTLNFADRLRRLLARPLPGRAAWARCEPRLAYGRHAGPAPQSARRAAVMALLYPDRGEWRVPLTLRPEHFTEHAAQICFPGGSIEPGETCESAALREINEELGVAAAEITVVGQLSELYLFATNYRVTPCVAVAESRPAMRPNPLEVQELIEPSLGELSRPEAIVSIMTPTAQASATGLAGATHVPAIAWGPHRIWGATSMMLAELLAVVQQMDEQSKGD